MAKLIFETIVNGSTHVVHVNDTAKDFEVEIFSSSGEKVDFEMTTELYNQLLEEAFYASFANQCGIEY